MKSILTAALLVLLTLPASAQTTLTEAIKDESAVTYTLIHPFHTIEATSRSVSYKLEVDPAKHEVKSVSATVDVMTFDSGNSNRDSHAMEVIDAVIYPDVAFSSTSVSQRGDDLTIAGKLTFHGVTNDIVATGAADWSAGKMEFQGAFPLSLTAFKIERPALLLIPVQDTLRFTIKAAFALK